MSTALAPVRRNLGDAWDDLLALTSVASSIGTPGGVGGWLADKLQEFRGLLDAVRTINAQAHQVRAVLEQNRTGGDDILKLAQVNDLTTQITRSYPDVERQVSAMVTVLSPVMWRLQQGDVDAATIAALASNGIDVIKTIHNMDTLTGLRDAARQLVQDVLNDPTLPAGVRQEAQQAATSANLTPLLLLAAAGVGAFFLMRRRR